MLFPENLAGKIQNSHRPLWQSNIVWPGKPDKLEAWLILKSAQNGGFNNY